MVRNLGEVSIARAALERLQREAREKTAQKVNPKRPTPGTEISSRKIEPPLSVMDVLTNVIHEQCIANGGTFNCDPRDLLTLIEQSMGTPVDADLKRMMAGNYVSEFAGVLESIRSHLKTRSINFTAIQGVFFPFVPCLRFFF